MKLEKTIGLWIDETSDAETPAWIVSLDEIDDSGNAVTTETQEVFGEDDYELAKEAAISLSERKGLPVYEDRDCIHTPTPAGDA